MRGIEAAHQEEDDRSKQDEDATTNTLPDDYTDNRRIIYAGGTS
jgi:hypothetical protein